MLHAGVVVSPAPTQSPHLRKLNTAVSVRFPVIHINGYLHHAGPHAPHPAVEHRLVEVGHQAAVHVPRLLDVLDPGLQDRGHAAPHLPEKDAAKIR